MRLVLEDLRQMITEFLRNPDGRVESVSRKIDRYRLIDRVPTTQMEGADLLPDI